MSSYLPLLNFLLSALGAASGVYLGLRVAIARIEEQLKATNNRIDDQGERITRLEDVFFKKP